MKKNLLIYTRKEADPKLNYRSMSIRASESGEPASLDGENRSVEVVGATEAPVDVFDYERWEIVPEVLLMSGCEMPGNRQVPLLDTHNRYEGASSVLGSYRDMRVDSDQLVGRAFFSSVAEAEGPYTKLREGHLTDFSVGYRPVESTWVPDGEKAIVKGRSFEGPVKVTTRWRVKELSICPIGADEQAKARAENQPTPKKREKKPMNEKLRKFLESIGLRKDADENEAFRFYTEYLEGKIAEPPTQAGGQASAGGGEGSRSNVDLDAERAEAVRIERERTTEIRAMCKTAGFDDMADGFVKDGKTVEQVRTILFDKITNQEQANIPHRMAEMQADEHDKFRSAAVDSLAIRGGSAKTEDPAPGAVDLAGFSLRALAREALRLAGQPVGGNPMEMVGRAMQTSDFPYILATTANKMLFEGWDTAEETWSVWCGVGQVSDFKTHTMPRVSEMDDLDEIPEHVPYKYGKRTEASESYSIATYGKLFAITRQAIINDDLAALTDIPKAHGEAAARKVGDLPYAVLTANAAMGDGTALFATGHGNYVAAGSGAAPGITTIAAAILAMKTQTDLQDKRRLNIRPEYFISPAAREGAAEVFFRSERFSDANTIATDSSMASTQVNPYAGNYFTRVYEPRLDDDDPAAWYLAARKGKTVTVFFLNGQKTPYMETKQGWSVDGVEYKVRIDAGAKAVDWRGLYFNDGN